MANNNSKDKIKVGDLIKAAKRNYKKAPKKNLYWIIGVSAAIIGLVVVWVGDLVNIFG
jgi:hypothetical protein